MAKKSKGKPAKKDKKKNKKKKDKKKDKKKKVKKPSPKYTSLVAVVGSYSQLGSWRVRKRLAVYSMVGSCRLDMRSATFDSPKSRVRVTAFLGRTELIVPVGTTVKGSGLSFLASSTVDVPESDGGQRSVRVTWTSVLAQVRVRMAEPCSTSPNDRQLESSS